eukprot:7383688-Prymnesium_polylepis.2
MGVMEVGAPARSGTRTAAPSGRRGGRHGCDFCGGGRRQHAPLRLPAPRAPTRESSACGAGGRLAARLRGPAGLTRAPAPSQEDFWEMSFIDCRDVRAALHRAFDTWSSHHKLIKFTDVSDECEKRGELQEGCSLAEVWVTFMNSSNPNYGVRRRADTL